MSYSDEDILKYCDGALSAEQTARIQVAAEHDATLARKIQAMEASRLPYKAAFAQQRVPDLPAKLTTDVDKWVRLANATTEVSDADEPPNRITGQARFHGCNWRVVGIAASLVLCFLLGYSLASLQNRPGIQQNQQARSSQDEWVQRVADYQSLYVENTVADVVGGLETARVLLDRIEERSQLQTGIPDLSDQGYTFVRAQELGYEGEPLVQLVYFKPGVAPLALCFMPSVDDDSTTLQIARHAGLSTANWVHDGQRFVIVAEESEFVLRSVYAQTSTLWL